MWRKLSGVPSRRSGRSQMRRLRCRVLPQVPRHKGEDNIGQCFAMQVQEEKSRRQNASHAHDSLNHKSQRAQAVALFLEQTIFIRACAKFKTQNHKLKINSKAQIQITAQRLIWILNLYLEIYFELVVLNFEFNPRISPPLHHHLSPRTEIHPPTDTAFYLFHE